jgi:hypothetical protein
LPVTSIGWGRYFCREPGPQLTAQLGTHGAYYVCAVSPWQLTATLHEAECFVGLPWVRTTAHDKQAKKIIFCPPKVSTLKPYLYKLHIQIWGNYNSVWYI